MDGKDKKPGNARDRETSPTRKGKRCERTYIFETADDYSYGLLKQYAKENRQSMTEAESILWGLIRRRGLGVKIRRQHIIDHYIADFVDLHHKLIIELDGKYHFIGNQPVSDAVRTAALHKMGYVVIRFKNEEVIGAPLQVLDKIKQTMKEIENARGKASGMAPSPIGEGRGGAGIINSWAVDAACSGNPGPMEYQGVDLETGRQLFHFGPCYPDGSTIYGTNNIGEFLAIVHALALLDKQGITDKTIYSDSYNAILWVKRKHCKTNLERSERTEPLFAIIARAEKWLRTHAVKTPIIQWQTRQWGDIPADFGRK